MRINLCAVMCAVLLVASANAQVAIDTSATMPSEQTRPSWSCAASLYTYFLPEAGDYVQPTFTADRRWLHLEARYNYEDMETGSVWLGYNFSFGQVVSLEVTPMIGGIFGNTTGIAPGYHASLSWRRFEFYSESEYVFDTGARDNSFFYNWSELTLAPADWLRAGLVAQRTRAYKSELEIPRGVLMGFSCKRMGVTAYIFNPDQAKPTYVISINVEAL